VDYRQLLLEHLALVDKVVRFVARRHHLSAGDAEEFGSLVRLKLVERDFAILRKFEQRSSLNTYLTVVIERLCLDFCIARWGKWRPSAMARRLGPVAVLLEQLIVREGITFDEAVGTLQTNHGVSMSRAELHALLLRLPSRPLRRATPAGEPVETPVPSYADLHDDESSWARVHAALTEALAALGPDDRRLLELRFGQGLSVPQIARILKVRRPLYRRLGQVIGRLRVDLSQRGISEAEIARIIGHPTFAVSGVFESPPPD
jgi:RNA polymerase sigma factor (sigma-70 family)